ncbi:hypothetical protein AVEN_179473-1 [Araneus ventricosus]|uniref:Uncharacterized protein n=1 Tax=Araneus ventricosus TaxID=182803 RepID=A0A4Y2BF21_ARAVE|nr:hypothetical protein AVEN_179473-1 [Araneus ventricosus]
MCSVVAIPCSLFSSRGGTPVNVLNSTVLQQVVNYFHDGTTLKNGIDESGDKVLITLSRALQLAIHSLKKLDFYRHLLSKGARILFSWVPSHVGITGNELADKSEKSATEFLTRPIVYADVRSAVNQWCHCQWQEKWNMETNNKLRVIKPVLSHWVTKLNRRCDVVLTRLRIGHT